MGLITVNYDNFESVLKVAENIDLLSEYSDVFDEGQGSLPGITRFVVDENVHPVITPACRVPHAMKSKVNSQNSTS